ncbi:hypothetical protein BJ508DRAFT_328369 [Ascobolus immersus RN42]|uniref:Uncharacterized protein n=1 Tax=Ascobolus immersus RN42 TaxID=1160509 RepID=A0A3N4I047_ASCIM|nr:hypothetical protein BJ508DRAFT_328369 [Ascobolus immersus RN42]
MKPTFSCSLRQILMIFTLLSVHSCFPSIFANAHHLHDDKPGNTPTVLSSINGIVVPNDLPDGVYMTALSKHSTLQHVVPTLINTIEEFKYLASLHNSTSPESNLTSLLGYDPTGVSRSKLGAFLGYSPIESSDIDPNRPCHPRKDGKYQFCYCYFTTPRLLVSDVSYHFMQKKVGAHQFFCRNMAPQTAFYVAMGDSLYYICNRHPSETRFFHGEEYGWVDNMLEDDCGSRVIGYSDTVKMNWKRYGRIMRNMGFCGYPAVGGG